MAGDDRKYTARDVKNLAGLSYRQVNDWEAKGALPGGDDRGAGWRKFSPRDVFALMVCSAIRQRFGVPMEKVKFVHDFMHRDDADHLRAAVSMMNLGLTVYLLTDFGETFIMNSDLEFLDLMTHGFFRADCPQGYVFLRINDIVNRLLGALKEPVELRPSDAVYGQLAEAHASWTACTPAEMNLLRLVRERQHDQLTIRLKDGQIIRIETEGDVAPNEVHHVGDAVGVNQTEEFETVTLHRRGGNVRARRKRPTPIKEDDNRRIFFGGARFTGGGDNPTENDKKK